MPSDTEYDAGYYQGNGQDGDRPALRLYTRIARRHLGRGPLLDFGCGTGHLLRRLAATGPADGLEVHEHPARAAARLVPRSVVHTALEDVGTSCYDGIVSIHVVEHIPDEGLRDVFREWARVLRPGGGVLVVTPDLEGRAHRLKGPAWSAFTDPTHINLKSHSAWHTLLAENGFRVERTAADGLWDFPYTPGRPRLLDAALRAWPTAYQFARGDLLLAPGTGEATLMLARRT